MKHTIVKSIKDFKTSEPILLTVNGNNYYALNNNLLKDIIKSFNNYNECYEVAGYLKNNKLIIFDENSVYFNSIDFKKYLKDKSIVDTTKNNYSKITLIGDSITYGLRASTPSKSYVSLLEDMLGINVVNAGVSASTIANAGNNPVISMYNRLHTNQINVSDSDIIGVFGGTNDFAQNIPIEGDTKKQNELVGATSLLIDEIKQKNNNALIFFVPPMWRARINDSTKFVDIETNPNDIGLFFKEYYNAIYKVCESKSVPVLDLYHDFIINKYNYPYYLADGLHPNDAGYHLLADIFYNYIHALAKKPNNLR